MDVYKYVFEKCKLHKLALSDNVTVIIGNLTMLGSSKGHDALVLLTDIMREKRQTVVNFKLDSDGNTFRIELSGSLHECFRIDVFHSSDGMITHIEMQNIHSGYFGKK